MLAPSALLARRALAQRHPGFPPPLGPLRLRRWLRSAWFVEGAAQWLSGQTRHVRPAVTRRLREGRPPSFPPGNRDALLLGGTVFDLLAREEGERAAVAGARGRRAAAARARLRRAGRAAHGGRLALAPRAAGRAGRRRSRAAGAESADHGEIRAPRPTSPTITTARRGGQDADPRRARAGGGSRAREVRLRRDLAAGGRARHRAGLRHEDVARARGEEVGDVEAAASGAPATGRPPRAASPGSARPRPGGGRRDADERALGVLRGILRARSPLGLGGSFDSAVHERIRSRAEALVASMPVAHGADERRSRDLERASETCRRRSHARTSSSPGDPRSRTAPRDRRRG